MPVIFTWIENYLDYCGHLCAATGRYAEAVTAWAALAVVVPAGKDCPGYARHREEPRRAARQALGPERARAAEERGAAMSRAAAAKYALLLTEDPGPRQPEAPPGLARLSAGSGNWSPWSPRARHRPQIASRLYISVRTVRSHLDRIRDKTGCRRRADLTRLTLAAGLI